MNRSTASQGVSHIDATLKRHDAEIAGIHTDMAAIRAGQGDLQTSVASLAGGMADIKSFISTTQANKPMAPLDSLVRYLQIAAYLGALLGMMTTGIVYVSSSANSGEYWRLKDRLERIERSVEWQMVPRQQPSAARGGS